MRKNKESHVYLYIKNNKFNTIKIKGNQPRIKCNTFYDKKPETLYYNKYSVENDILTFEYILGHFTISHGKVRIYGITDDKLRELDFKFSNIDIITNRHKINLGEQLKLIRLVHNLVIESHVRIELDDMTLDISMVDHWQLKEGYKMFDLLIKLNQRDT